MVLDRQESYLRPVIGLVRYDCKEFPDKEEALEGHQSDYFKECWRTLECVRLIVLDNNVKPFHFRNWRPIEYFAAKEVVKD